MINNIKKVSIDDNDMSWDKEYLYSTVINASPDIIAITDLCGKILFISPRIKEFSGFSTYEIIGRNCLEFIMPEQYEEASAKIGEIIHTNKPWLSEYKIANKDGTIAYWEWHGQLLCDYEGNAKEILFIGRDITKRKKAEQLLVDSEARYRSLFNTMLNGLILCEVIFDKKGQPIDYLILDVNPAFTELLSMDADYVVNKRVSDILSTDFFNDCCNTFKIIILNNQRLRWEKYSELMNQYFEIVAYCPQPGQLIVAFADITERKMMMSELELAATTDKLTGVLNRRQFEINVQMNLDKLQEKQASLSLIIFDVDDFKQINDTYGHLFGDAVLKGICKNITKELTGDDYFARWGGEEFALIAHCDLQGAVKKAENIRNILSRLSFSEKLSVSASFGVTTYRQGDSLDSIVNRADKAMYDAKNRGKNQVQVI